MIFLKKKTFALLLGILLLTTVIFIDSVFANTSIGTFQLLESNKIYKDLSKIIDVDLVNTFTTNYQENPDIASNINGRTVVVWQSVNQANSSYSVYAQIYDIANNKIGSEIIVSDTYNYGGDPSVDILPNGDFVVTWSRFVNETRVSRGGGSIGTSDSLNGTRTITTPGNIYARLYNFDGTPKGSSFIVNNTVPMLEGYMFSNFQEPEVAAINNGSFMIVWHGLLSTNSNGPPWDDTNIAFYRIFDQDGNPTNTVDSYVANDFDNTSRPDIDATSDKFIVTWLDGVFIDETLETQYSIMFAKFDEFGTKIINDAIVNRLNGSNNISINTIGSNNIPRFRISTNENNFVVVWDHDDLSSLISRSNGKIFSTSGNLINSFKIGTSDRYEQLKPDVDINESGVIYVSWIKNDRQNYSALVQKYNLNGIADKLVHQVSSTDIHQYLNPVIESYSSEKFTTAWHGKGKLDVDGTYLTTIKLFSAISLPTVLKLKR